MKKLLTTVFAGLMAASSWAMPVQPGTFTVTQSDGTVLTLMMVGDEYHSYFVDVNTGVKMERSANGDFVPVNAVRLNRELAFAAVRREANNARRVERLTARRAALDAAMTPDGQRKAGAKVNQAMVGSKKGLVILMDFPDLKYQPENNQATMDRVFNEVGYSDYNSIGSVHDYFKDQSYGQFDLTFDVVGPYTTANDMVYYGANEPFNNHPEWGNVQDRKAVYMIKEAILAADKDVNFADYDWDGDGVVDQVFVIYPGLPESYGRGNLPDCIWPHESSLSMWGQYFPTTIGKMKVDGVTVDTYACSSELTGPSGTTRAGIGTACHEFSHCLGYPDIYDVNLAARTNFGMSALDIMDNGGYNGPSLYCEVPCGFTAYERWMAGWLEPEELYEGKTVTGMKNIGDEREAYVIHNDAHRDEYFLLENRTPDGWFKYVGSYIMDQGLLVTHVDYDAKVWANNTVNAEVGHPRLQLVPAGKQFGILNNGQFMTTRDVYETMFFPGTKRATSLTDEGYAEHGLKLYNKNLMGNNKLNAPITEITRASDGTISFIFKEGSDAGERWTVTLDSGSGQCSFNSWTQSKHNESIQLPPATIDMEGWDFIGWTTENVSATSECPAVIYAAGDMLQPTADMCLYAVYGYYNGTIDDSQFVQTDHVSNATNYLVVGKSGDKYYALNSLSILEDTPMSTISGKAVTVSTANGLTAIQSPAANLQWTMSLNGNTFTLENNKMHLHFTASGLEVNRDQQNMTWSATNGLSGVEYAGGPRYYLTITGNKFGLAGSADATNRVYLFSQLSLRNVATSFATSPTETSGISSATAPSAPAALYDLQGRRLNAPAAHKGIYIDGKRKVVR